MNEGIALIRRTQVNRPVDSSSLYSARTLPGDVLRLFESASPITAWAHSKGLIACQAKAYAKWTCGSVGFQYIVSIVVKSPIRSNSYHLCLSCIAYHCPGSRLNKMKRVYPASTRGYRRSLRLVGCFRLPPPLNAVFPNPDFAMVPSRCRSRLQPSILMWIRYSRLKHLSHIRRDRLEAKVTIVAFLKCLVFNKMIYCGPVTWFALALSSRSCFCCGVSLARR